MSCRKAPCRRPVAVACSTAAAKSSLARPSASSTMRGPNVGSSLRRRSVSASRDQSTSAVSRSARSPMARRRAAVPALSRMSCRSAWELAIEGSARHGSRRSPLVARWRSRGAVQFHLQQLQVAPGEGCEQLARGLSFEVAVGAGVWVRCRWGSGPALEGHVRGRVPDDDPVALRRFGDHQRQPRKMQRGEVEVGIEPQMCALGQRQRFGGVPVGPLGR